MANGVDLYTNRAEIARGRLGGSGVAADVRGAPKKVHNEGSPSARLFVEVPQISGSRSPEQGRIPRRSIVDGRHSPVGDRNPTLGKAPWLEYVTAPNGTMRISSGCTWKTSAGTSC